MSSEHSDGLGSKLRKDPQPVEETCSAAEEAAVKPEVGISIRAVLELPEKIVSQYEAANREQNRLEADELTVDKESLRINKDALEINKAILAIEKCRSYVEIVVLFCVIGTALFTFWQWDEMHKTLVEMAKQTPGIIDAGNAAVAGVKEARLNREQATRDSTSAAEENRKAVERTLVHGKAALDASIENSRLDQRAWVGKESLALPECLDEHKKAVLVAVDCNPRFGVNITNSGKSPAIDFSTLVGGRIQRADKKWEDPKYENLIGTVSKSVLFPGEKVTHYSATFSRPISALAIEGIRSGSVMVYFFGRMEYKDAFNRNHETTFCVYVAKDLSGFEGCPFYNTAN